MDSVYTHKMWNDHELSKMLDGKDIPFPMLSRLRSLISLCLLALAATHGLFAQAAPVPVVWP